MKENTDFFLELISCEKQILSGKDYTMHRKNGRADYHILYITEGCCHALIGGEMQKVEKGNIILYKPFEEQLYKFYACDKPVSCYIHFCGKDCDTLINSLCLDKSVIEVGLSHTLQKLFIEMRDEYIVQKPFKREVCGALLLRFLSHAARCARYKEGKIDVRFAKRMQEVCSHMNMHYKDNLTVEYYAKKCNLSVDRFSHAFKESVGCSPKHYMLSIKVQVACDLLRNTDLDILKISQEVGIEDRNYFSKLIKRYTSQSPKEFRNY